MAEALRVQGYEVVEKTLPRANLTLPELSGFAPSSMCAGGFDASGGFNRSIHDLTRLTITTFRE